MNMREMTRALARLVTIPEVRTWAEAREAFELQRATFMAGFRYGCDPLEWGEIGLDARIEWWLAADCPLAGELAIPEPPPTSPEPFVLAKRVPTLVGL